MAYNTRSIKKDVDGRPVPQYFNSTADDYEPLLGENGAARSVLYGPNGQPLSVIDNKLAVRAADLETLIGGVKTAVDVLAGTVDTQAGVQKVALSGRNVGIHTLVDAVEIRDTNSFSGRTVAGSVLAAYKELDLFAIDSHDQPIQLVFTTGSDPAFTGSHYRVRGESDWSARPTTITDANSLNRPLVLRSDPNIGAFLASRVWAIAGIGVRVGVPGSAPKSGALTVVAIGVIN